MKTRLVSLVCVLVLLAGTVTPCMASTEGGSLEAVADVLVVRPGCFVATVLGSALFVVALPVAAISRSIPRTAQVLVVTPAKATFTRPVGDMEDLVDIDW
ncbi:MAG TPA: hypothetical protein VMU04_08295 [Candidatus Acidoferrum sp.]|nr:hypothetical protein [Candidatus Acidoferrum sp.]